MVIRTSTPTRLPDLPTSWVMVYSKEGNQKIWWAGYGNDVPQVGVGIPLFEGKVITFSSTNANHLSFIAENDGDEIYVVAGLSGDDVDLTPGDPDPLDVTPPTISSHFPTPSGTTDIERNVVITLTASESLDPVTVDDTTVTLKTTVVATTVPATITLAADDPTKISITPTSDLTASTDYTVTVTTSVKDLIGNAFAAPFSFMFTTKAAAPPPDTTPPTIVSASPSSGATSVAISVAPTVTFSEAMLSSSITTSTIRVLLASNSTVITGTSVSLSTDNKTATLTLPALSYSTSYKVRISGGSSGVKDLAGNALVSTTDVPFSTAAPSLETVYSVTGNDYDNLYSGNYTETHIKISNSSSKLRDRKGKQYTLVMKKVGSPTGNVTFVWYRSGADYRTISTIATSSIGTSDTTFNIDDSTNTVAFATSDRLIVRYTGGSSSSYVRVKISNYNAFDGSNTINSKKLGSFTFDYSDEDLAGTIKCE